MHPEAMSACLYKSTQIFISEGLLGEMADSRTRAGKVLMNLNFLLYHKVRKQSNMMRTYQKNTGASSKELLLAKSRTI